MPRPDDMRGWIEDEMRSGDIHVYPTFGRKHDTDHGTNCWCQPERDAEEPRVIVHHPEQ